METRSIWRFYIDECYGSLSGIFTATKSRLEELINKTVYFGEILGKHSCVTEELSWDDFELISNDPNVVELFESLGMETGVNPLDYEIVEE